MSRAYKIGGDLRDAGMSEDQINEMAADVITRGERMDPLAPPPPEAKVLEHFGEDKKVLTPTEAANELTNWRERHAQAQQEALAELVGEAEQERQAEAQRKRTTAADNHNSSTATAATAGDDACSKRAGFCGCRAPADYEPQANRRS